MFGSKDLLFSSEKYGVAKSLRFRSSASAYLSRTPSNTSGTKCTFSTWIKLGSLASGTNNGTVIGAADNNYYFQYYDNTLYFGNASYYTNTASVFRDFSSWYHVFFVVDSTLATTNDRMQIWVNGVRQTVGSLNVQPAQNASFTFLNSSQVYYIGARATGQYFDGYLAEVNFIDGQALTPSSFGFYDNNGIWQPAGYTGTYGTNGFYLKFTDVGATSGANSGYGKDFSGFNTNYWTTNNFGTTSTATTYDSMLDSPTNATGDIGNYAVLNPLKNSATLSEANLKITQSAASWASTRATIQPALSGKYYFEFTSNTNFTANNVSYIGISTPANTDPSDANIASIATSTTAGEVLAVAIDRVNNTISTYRNNSLVATTTGVTTADLDIQMGCYQANGFANFGQRPFAYTPPSGYSALNTQNLTTPTITNGAAYMAAVTYTGSASTQNVTATSTNSGNNPNAVTFQPDLVWIKDRSNAQDHKWTDVVRGATKALESNTTDDEATDSNGVTAFNNNGFSLGTGTRAYSDSNGDSYIAWEWKENVSSGFDIVTYTGNGSARTISHSLNAVPNMIIVKARTTASTDQGWPVYHSANTSAPETDYLMLNTTAATADLDTVWNDTAPTSAVFSVGTNANVNANNDTYVAYLWAAIAGYSAFGSYTGNGSATDGPFVYTGFRPRWLLFKQSSAAGEYWHIMDSTRSPYNGVALDLYPNLSNAEATYGTPPFDFVSNGFKIRDSNTGWNTNGATYIYAAFAENPFKISRAR